MTDQAAMPKEISEAISKVMGSVGYVQKKGTNAFHNYKFAAVGDLLAKVQPAMVEAGLVIIQSEISHSFAGDDNVMMATYEFSLTHTSGAQWSEKPKHTGMAGAKNSKGGHDDKALNKCHTAARKYFLLALFQIPTGELPDPDEEEDKPAVNPKTEATNWAKDAEAHLKDFKTLDEFEAWHTAKTKTIYRLRDLNEAAHKRLTDAIRIRATELSTLNAG